MKDYKVKVSLTTDTSFDVNAEDENVAMEMVKDLIKKVNFIDRKMFNNEICFNISIKDNKGKNNNSTIKIK